jgi:hypothetical protein
MCESAFRDTQNVINGKAWFLTHIVILNNSLRSTGTTEMKALDQQQEVRKLKAERYQH